MLASVTHSERVCDLQAFVFFLVGERSDRCKKFSSKHQAPKLP